MANGKWARPSPPGKSIIMTGPLTRLGSVLQDGQLEVLTYDHAEARRATESLLAQSLVTFVCFDGEVEKPISGHVTDVKLNDCPARFTLMPEA